MLRELRVYLRLRPHLKRIGDLMRMPFSWNLIVQVIGVGIQGLNSLGDLVGDEHRTTLALVVGVIGQAVVGGVVVLTDLNPIAALLGLDPGRVVLEIAGRRYELYPSSPSDRTFEAMYRALIFDQTVFLPLSLRP